jgi:hypothetical protein
MLKEAIVFLPEVSSKIEILFHRYSSNIVIVQFQINFLSRSQVALKICYAQ